MRLRRIIPVALIAVMSISLLAGVAVAGKYGKKHLLGTWEFDLLEMMKQSPEFANMPEGMDLSAMFKDKYMRITFHKDGTYVVTNNMSGRGTTEEGKWELLKSEENTLHVKSIDAEGEEQEIPITFTDENAFEAAMADGDQKVKMSATRVTKEAEKEMKKKASSSD